MADRRRNFFILLLVFGLLSVSVAVIATRSTQLGLDLKGGVSLVYEAKPTPQVPEVTPEALQRAIDILRKRVDALGVAEPEIAQAGSSQIEISLPGVEDFERAKEQVGTTAQLFFYDWEPNVLDADCEPDPENRSVTEQPIVGKEEAVKRAAKCPGENDGDNTRRGSTFYVFDAEGEQIATGDSRQDALAEQEGRAVPAGGAIYEVREGVKVVKAEVPDTASTTVQQNFDQWFVIRDDPALGGTDIKNPEQQFDQTTNEPIVTMEFTDEGRDAFQEITRNIAQRGSETLPTLSAQERFQHFAIVLDEELVSRPFIDFQENPDGIDGGSGAQISGGFTITTAQDLSNFLKIGALPIELERISESAVSASLGQQALDQGMLAGLLGFAVVALFLLLMYRVLGLIAVVALAVYAVYFYALIKLIPITMTLPGIAGTILTIGVAADANIVVFERVKEEIRAGRSIAAGIATGYKKGFATILDANVVTLLVAFILFVLATAGVKGFAFTLGVGTIVSLFTAVLATQAILLSMRNSRMIQHPSALGAGEERVRWKFDFMGASKWFFSASGLILLVCALALSGKGLSLGIDFESGTRIKADLEQTATVDQVRSALPPGLDGAEVQTVGDPKDGVFQVTVPELDEQGRNRVVEQLDREFGVAESSGEVIGPTFGESVARSAIIAIIASLLVISVYIALRFEWKYAVPVLIALSHDLLITAGIYALVGLEVSTSTVAALLTILGFSLYDTIIVFDRIRENVPRMPNAAFSQIVNRSMSEVLTRSLATSFCTGLPVLGLLVFGGETLKDFAFALLIGTLSGTYSSVFIAGPVLTAWKEREQVYRRRRARILEAFGGRVPPYAQSVAGLGPADIEPSQKPSGRRGATAPGQPGEISKEEFDALVRDLDVDKAPPPAAPARPGGRRAARRAGGGADAEGAGGATSASAPPSSPGGAAPGDGSAAGGDGDKTRKPRNRRHGRPR